MVLLNREGARSRLIALWLAIYSLVSVGSPLQAATPTDASDEAVSAAKSDPVEPRRIQVLSGSRGSLGREFERQVTKFNDSQKRVQVELRHVDGYGAVNQELQKGFQSGDLPDVAVIEIHSVATFAADKRIVMLDSFIQEDPGFQPDDLLPGILSNLRYDEKLFALPMNRSTPILYFNKQRFRDAGLDPTKPPATWEQLRAMSRKLAEPGAREYGFLVRNHAWIFESLVWGAGGQLVQDRSPTFAMSGAKPLQLWADMVHQDETARYRETNEWYEEFTSGRAAMVIESTALLQSLTERSNFEVGTALIPPLEGFKNAVPTGGGAAVIPAGIPKENQTAVWEFLTWFISTRQTAEFSRATGYIPVRTSARDLLKAEGFYEKYPEFETAIVQMKYAREAPNLKQWAAAWNLISESMTTVLRDNAPALETLRGAEEKVETLLNPRASE